MMIRHLHAALALGLFVSLQSARAGDAPATAGGVAQAAPADHAPNGHALAEETAKIRQHHLKRLDDRIAIEPHVLHETCRYESDISTRPPARRVALTFDDGPEPGQTERILEVLQAHGIGAAFFVIGSKARRHPELVDKVLASGRNLVGNHSWDHPNFHDIGVAQQSDEVGKTDRLLAERFGARLFRYPYGNSSCETNTLLHGDGYRIVGWHIDSCDWAFDHDGSVDAKEALSCGVLRQNTKDFVEHVVSSVRAHDGGIVLFHEIHPHTLERLDEIVTRLQRDGFEFVRVDDPAFSDSLR